MGDPFSFGGNSEIFEEDFTEQIVNVNWPGGATEFNNAAFIAAPGTVETARFTISMFVKFPSEFGSSTNNAIDVIGFGIADPTLQRATSGLTFQGDGTGKIGIFCGFYSFMVDNGAPQEGDVNTPQFQITLSGAQTENSGNPTGRGVMTAGEWHHVFTSVDLSDIIIIDDPQVTEGGDRFFDHLFACFNPLYVDTVRVGVTNAAIPTPLDYSGFGTFEVGPPGSNTYRTTTSIGSLTNTAFPDGINGDMSFAQTFETTYAAISFLTGLGVPNLTGASVGGEGNNTGFTSSPVQLAGVQVWTNQCIHPSGNLDKFAKIGKDGKVQMVDPKVAEKAFGEPAYSFNGPPKKFVTNLGVAGDPGVFGQIGSTIKQVKGPPKAQ